MCFEFFLTRQRNQEQIQKIVFRKLISRLTIANHIRTTAFALVFTEHFEWQHTTSSALLAQTRYTIEK